MKLRNTLWIDLVIALAVLILIILVSLNASIPTRNFVTKWLLFSSILITALKFLILSLSRKWGIILFEIVLILILLSILTIVFSSMSRVEMTDLTKQALIISFPAYGYLILFNVQLWNDRNS